MAEEMNDSTPPGGQSQPEQQTPPNPLMNPSNYPAAETNSPVQTPEQASAQSEYDQNKGYHAAYTEAQGQANSGDKLAEIHSENVFERPATSGFDSNTKLTQTTEYNPSQRQADTDRGANMPNPDISRLTGISTDPLYGTKVDGAQAQSFRDMVSSEVYRERQKNPPAAPSHAESMGTGGHLPLFSQEDWKYIREQGKISDDLKGRMHEMAEVAAGGVTEAVQGYLEDFMGTFIESEINASNVRIQRGLEEQSSQVSDLMGGPKVENTENKNEPTDPSSTGTPPAPTL